MDEIGLFFTTLHPYMSNIVLTDKTMTKKEVEEQFPGISIIGSAESTKLVFKSHWGHWKPKFLLQTEYYFMKNKDKDPVK